MRSYITKRTPVGASAGRQYRESQLLAQVQVVISGIWNGVDIESAGTSRILFDGAVLLIDEAEDRIPGPLTSTRFHDLDKRLLAFSRDHGVDLGSKAR